MVGRFRTRYTSRVAWVDSMMHGRLKELHAPKLAKGDGRVGDYRRYVKQFYPLDADGNEVSDPQSPVPIRKQASLA